LLAAALLASVTPLRLLITALGETTGATIGDGGLTSTTAWPDVVPGM